MQSVNDSPDAGGSTGLLSGTRVLDLSRILAGPIAAQVLGDYGAEVIKVERPRVGDDARHYGPVFLTNQSDGSKGDGPLYLSANRNKRSVTIDISRPDGQDLVRRLAAVSDVVIENYKVGTLARFGLDYASLSVINPRLVYCSITGFGQTGPYAARPGYDGIFQAMGGLMSVTGHEDGAPGAGPVKVGPSIADMITGYNAAAAILAALLHRNAVAGRGQYIDLALLDCVVAAMSHYNMQYLISGTLPVRRGTEGNGGLPAGVFECADGSVMLAVGTDEQYRRFCKVIGREDLAADPRFTTIRLRAENRHALRTALQEALRGISAAQLLAELDAVDVPAGPLNDLAQVFADPQVRHRGMAVDAVHPTGGPIKLVANPARFSATPVRNYAAPPTLGEGNDDVLRGLLGLDAGTMDRLAGAGVI